MNILLIVGATRANAKTYRAKNFLLKFFKNNYPEIDIKTTSPLDYKIDEDDNKIIPEYSLLVNNSDGIIILSPEYNHGYPGKLKSLLDREYSAYKDKPVLIASVSDGAFGGVRMIENLTPVLKALGLRIMQKDIVFPQIDKIVFEDGEVKDSTILEKIGQSIELFIKTIKN